MKTYRCIPDATVVMSSVTRRIWGVGILLLSLVALILPLVAAFFFMTSLQFIYTLIYPSGWASSWIPWTLLAGVVLLPVALMLLGVPLVRVGVPPP